MTEELLEILQKIADRLELLENAVKGIQKPAEPPVTPSPSPSWVEAFRASWRRPKPEEWPSSWGSYPFDQDGNPKGIRIPVSLADPSQLELARQLARWGFGPMGNVAIWSASESETKWNRMKALFEMDESAWMGSPYAKHNVEPDLVAFLTCVGQFNPFDPYDGEHFGTGSNRVDKLANYNLADYIRKNYFNYGSGGTPSGNAE